MVRQEFNHRLLVTPERPGVYLMKNAKGAVIYVGKAAVLRNRLRSYFGSPAGLDGSIAKAVERGKSWFGYYWSPTALAGKYGMVKVPFGVPFAGSENWDGCMVKPEDECAEPKPSAWTRSEVHTVVTERFKNNGGVALDYLRARVFPGDVMNGMLAYMEEHQATGEDAALEFLRKHEDIWTKWVSADAAANVKSSL